jgi:hypothetical protein
MATRAYYHPPEVRLQFSDEGVAHNPTTALAREFSAGVRRSIRHFEAGYADGLLVFWGIVRGQVTATDLVAVASYDHTWGTWSAGTHWLPSDLIQLSGTSLDTDTITIYFQPDGVASTTACAAFECLARPEQLSPERLEDGLTATRVAYRWRVQDETPASI